MFFQLPDTTLLETDLVLWKRVDEGWIRFSRSSGSTQLLSPLAKFILDMTDRASHPVSDREVITELLRLEPHAQPEECGAEVAATLAALAEAQLIQPISF